MKKIKRLRNESNLDRALESTREKLMNLRAQLASGGSITNPREITLLKKRISRILTLKREQELGINLKK